MAARQRSPAAQEIRFRRIVPLAAHPPPAALRQSGIEINGVEKDYSNGEYGPDLVNDYAMEYITRHKDKPFLLYYPMMLTHGPYQPTPDSKTWDPQAQGEEVNRRPEHFADMVTYMDKLIGKLVTSSTPWVSEKEPFLSFWATMERAPARDP